MTAAKIFTQKRIEFLNLIISTVTLLIILFTAYKAISVMNRVDTTVAKIELTVRNPVKEAANKAADFVEKEAKHAADKLRGKQ